MNRNTHPLPFPIEVMIQKITNTNENIENILLGVAEQNNEVRVQAEKALTDLEANRDNYILSLLSVRIILFVLLL